MNPQYQTKTISPDEYVDMAIKNVLNYNARVAEKEVFDLAKVMDLQIYLINQCETTCIGCGFINRKKKKLDINNLDEHEKALYEAARKYFSSKEEIFGANVDRLATSMLEQAVEGEYDSKVSLMEARLQVKVDAGELKADSRDMQLANYKFQLMLDAVNSSKSKRADFEV